MIYNGWVTSVCCSTCTKSQPQPVVDQPVGTDLHMHRTSADLSYVLFYSNDEKRTFMLWSQIKSTSYDFSDLHITGKFDYLPGTGRCFRFFLLRGHVWYRRRPASVYNNIGRCPVGHRTTSNVKKHTSANISIALVCCM